MPILVPIFLGAAFASPAIVSAAMGTQSITFAASHWAVGALVAFGGLAAIRFLIDATSPSRVKQTAPPAYRLEQVEPADAPPGPAAPGVISSPGLPRKPSS